ncbi:MAG: HAD family hydrolase, partial [bacterium]
IFVIKRPLLYDFLLRISLLGTISVFTANQQRYADPILNKLDPAKKLFHHRFYGDSCLSDLHG